VDVFVVERLFDKRFRFREYVLDFVDWDSDCACVRLEKGTDVWYFNDIEIAVFDASNDVKADSCAVR
jgi:hypothetical protein